MSYLFSSSNNPSLPSVGDSQLKRFVYYFASLFLGICIFALPLKKLMGMALDSHLYSYIPLVFATSCWLLVSGRKEIFENPEWSFGYGAFVLILSLVAGVAGLRYEAQLLDNDWLSVMAFSFWLFLAGTFMLFFGMRTFRKAIFPLGLLLFTIPFPACVLDKIVGCLQTASFTVAGWIFNALGFFPIKEGFSFKFPEITIVVAPECSGIRSSVALVILSLLSGHLFLKSKLNRILLVVFAVLIAIFKNGVRIVGLTMGAIYVDPRILTSYLHRMSGVPVFILAFAMLSLVVVVMKKLEKSIYRRDAESAEKTDG